MKQVLHDIGKQTIGNETKRDSTRRYARRVIQHVNKEKGKPEEQKRKNKTGMIKVSGIIHKRAKQIYPRLA